MIPTPPRSPRIVGDAAVLAGAFLAAVLLHLEFTLPPGVLHRLEWWVPLAVVISLVSLVIAGGHRHPWRFTDVSEIGVIGKAMLAAVLVTLALWYAAPALPVIRSPIDLRGLSRAVIVLHGALGFLGLCGVRLASRLLHARRRRRERERRGLRSRQVLLLGAGRTGRIVANELDQHPELMLRPVGFVDDRPTMQGQFIAGLPVLGTVDDLPAITERYQPDSALLTWDDPCPAARRTVREAAEEVLPVRTVPPLCSVLGGEVEPVTDDAGENRAPEPVEPEPPPMPLAKRALDVVGGSVLAVLLTPLIAVLAVASAVQLRSWPFFIQERLGLGQQRFRFPKIRTMPPDAPSYELLPDERELPALCRWMRRHHLDELPQLYLVPFGRMSLVGPRPKMPDDVEPTDEHYRTVRTLVPQGCTCLWQIGVHTDGLPSDSPEYDFWYLTHASVVMDLWILWETGLQLLGLGRDRTLQDIPGWITRRGWLDTELVTGELEAPTPTRSGPAG